MLELLQYGFVMRGLIAGIIIAIIAPFIGIFLVLRRYSLLVVTLSIPIIGILLISALIVIPVLTALQFRKSFQHTLIIAEAVSLLSVITGIIASFYLNLSTGGTIVIITLACFIVAFALNSYRPSSHTDLATP